MHTAEGEKGCSTSQHFSRVIWLLAPKNLKKKKKRCKVSSTKPWRSPHGRGAPCCSLLLFKLKKGPTNCLAGTKAPACPALPGGCEQPAEDAAGKLQSVHLLHPWGSGLREKPGIAPCRVSGCKDHRSVCKYCNGRVQPFGVRERKINAISPL